MAIRQELILDLRADDKASAVVNRAAGNIEKSSNRAGKAMGRLNANSLRAAAGFASIGAGAVALTTSFSVLDKAQTKVAASAKGQKAAEDTLALSITTLSQNKLSLAKSEQKLILLREKGTTSAQKLSLAEDDLAIKTQKVIDQESKVGTNRENLTVTSLRLRDAEVDLGDTRANFFANLAPQILALTIGTVTAVSSLTTANLSSIPATLAKTKAHLAERLALIGSTLATRAQTVAVKLLQIAMGPVGIAILAITTLFTLWATNTFGVRDKINELGRTVLNFLEVHLKPLADILNFLNVKVIRPLTQGIDKFLNPSLKDAADATEELQESVIPTTVSIEEMTRATQEAQQAFDPGLTGASDASSLEIQLLNDRITTLEDTIANGLNPTLAETAKQMSGIDARIKSNIDNYGAMGRTAIQVAEQTLAASGTTVIGLNAIAGVQEKINNLIQLQNTLRNKAQNPLGLVGRKSTATSLLEQGKSRDLLNQSKGISREIDDLVRLAQSLSLAAGATGLGLFGGGITTAGGTTFSPGRGQAVTSGNTLITSRTPLRPGVDISVSEAIARGVGNFDREAAGELIGAAHGFRGTVNKPTVFLAGEAGQESVNIQPTGSRQGLSTRERDMIATIARTVIREVLVGIESSQNPQGGLIG